MLLVVVVAAVSLEAEAGVTVWQAVKTSSINLPKVAKMNVSHEVELLVVEMKRLGKVNSEGNHVVTFGALFNDDKCANLFEALVGTLRAAKRKKIVSYDGELLLQGVHDNVEITLLAS